MGADDLPGTLAAVAGWALLGVFVAVCVFAAVTDARERRIPNAAVAVGSLAGLAWIAVATLAPASFPASHLALYGPGVRVAVALAVLGLGFGFEALWRRLRNGAHGVGMGDVKFCAMAALWLGPDVIFALALASVAALAVNLPRGRRTFAFGPYLAFAAIAALLVRLAF